MGLSDEEIRRRRPVWEAFSTLFLDTEPDDGQRRWIANVIVASGYPPSEIEKILWEEVYPLLWTNLLSLTGIWEGFDLDWLEEQIIAGRYRRTLPVRLVAMLPLSPGHGIRQEWMGLLRFLPERFRHATRGA